MIFWSIVLIVLSLIGLLVIRTRRKYNYFREANIPGPPTSFLIGNFDVIWQTSSYFRLLETWSRQYGKIYGIFEGTLPIYVVSDVDFLEEVFIKQFASFDTRKPALFMLADQEKRMHVANARGPKWRRQRRVINPIFSEVKLTSMIPTINACVDEFIDILQSFSDKHTDVDDIRPIYFRLTMDAVCK